ncbi:MAG: Gfo/Idh/MocA family oxidoreductase [Verrucomicrobiales bacterium]
MMDRPTRYALVGAGARGGFYIDALTDPALRGKATLCAICDLSAVRMRFHNARLAAMARPPVAAYGSGDFERLVAEAQPDAVIVATTDAAHAGSLIRALDLGCDAFSEKPLAIRAEELASLAEAVARSGKSLRVLHNYRHSPAHAKVRELVAGGAVGRPLAVDFQWLVDTRHGADYFRRWHRDKAQSGGLLVHKGSHHFDLVNWWLGSRPDQVIASAALQFYGRANAEARGESYPYPRYTGVAAAAGDPFALCLQSDAGLRGLYFEAEAETGYRRDQNVFGDGITAEDTMHVLARYGSGARLSYSLTAFSPREGMAAAITGTKGRLELRIDIRQPMLQGDSAAAAQSGSGESASLRLYPMFGDARDIPIAMGSGSHGGADRAMVERLFGSGDLGAAASFEEGAAAALAGIAANRSLESGMPVDLADVFARPSFWAGR